jgi:hypothetical protein
MYQENGSILLHNFPTQVTGVCEETQLHECYTVYLTCQAFEYSSVFFFGEFVPAISDDTAENPLAPQTELSVATIATRLQDGSLLRGFIRRWLPLGDAGGTSRVKVVFDTHNHWSLPPPLATHACAAGRRFQFRVFAAAKSGADAGPPVAPLTLLTHFRRCTLLSPSLLSPSPHTSVPLTD